MEGQINTPVAWYLAKNIPEAMSSVILEKTSAENEINERDRLMSVEQHLSPIRKRIK